MRRIGLALLAAGVVGIAALLLQPRPAPTPAPVPAPTPAPPARRPVYIEKADRPAPILGVNEGLRLPTAGSLFGAGAKRATLQRRATMLRTLGAGVIRVNNHGWPWLNHHEYQGPAAMDELVSFAKGLDLVVVLGPWPGTRTAAYTDRYLPDDLDAYAAWVTTIVERYDGDGADDAPGLDRPVLAWEADNEPDHHHLMPQRGHDGAVEPGTFETPAEYAAVLLATARGVRAADPSATVLIGGLRRLASADGQAYLREVLAWPGVREAAGGLSVHCYMENDSTEPPESTMDAARAVAPGLPVWVTETSVPSEGPAEYVSEEWQARVLVGWIGSFLARGATRVLWHSLSDGAVGEGDEAPGMKMNALFRVVEDGDRTSFELKTAGAAYARLAARLAGVGAGEVGELPADGGRLLETPRGWLAFDGAPAVPAGAASVVDLMTGEPAPPGAYVSAPAWIERR